MPQNAFFSSTNSRSSGQPKKDAKTLFFSTCHPLSAVFFATATVLAFVLLRDSFKLYTAWSNAYSEIRPEVRCDLSRLLARKITKCIHSRNKPRASKKWARTIKPKNLSTRADNYPVTGKNPQKPSKSAHLWGHFFPDLTFSSILYGPIGQGQSARTCISPDSLCLMSSRSK